MDWRYLGHSQLLSKAVAVSAEVEISSQEEMANPQGMKLFAVERHGLPEDFVYENLCASDLRSSDLYAQVIRANYCTPYTPLHMDASITRTGRNG